MIEHEAKELFNKRSVDKQFYIKYGNGNITNLELRQESFNLTETLCSEQELAFGCCEASSISFLVSRVFTALKNDLLDVSVVLDRNADNAFKIGKYKVYSSVPTADKKEKEVLAYDAMYDVINADVAAWYNTILPNADSNVTLREFRYSFFDYFGLEQVDITLPNDDMVVKKTVQTDKLSGKDVVTAICEVNGCFGHINRDGKMDYVFLKEKIDAIYPSDDLFPAEDLYPSGNNYETFNTGNYYGCQYEDYVVKKIDALEIREQENSLGISVGDGNNRYVINGNMLLLGKTEEELTVIAQKIFDVIKHIEYRPFEATMRANLCRELGDLVRFNTKYDIFYSYILERRVTGIQNLIDTMSASGEEYRTAQVNSLQSDVLQLRGKTNVLERNIDETRSEITKVESSSKNYTDAQVGDMAYRLDKGTDEKLKNYSTTAEMKSEISQTAEAINLSVDKKVTETKEYADNAASTATSNANSATDEKLKSYSTTTEMQGKIDASADAINLSVSEQIKETKKYTDTSLEDYSTTEEMNGAISLSAQGITQEVSKTYATKTETQELSSRVEQTAEEISSKVEKGEVISEINQSAESVKIKANKIELEGTVTANGNVTIGADGKLDAKNGSFEGLVDATALYVDNAILMKAAGLGMTTLARMIWLEKWSDIYWQNSNPGLRLYSQTRIGDIEFSGSGIYAKGTSTWRSGGTSLIQNSAGIVGLYPQSFRPDKDYADTFSLGWSSVPWNAIYSKDGTIQKSDANMKHDIFDISEKYEQLFFETKPCTYVFNDGKRTHIGTISQWVEEALEKVGLTSEEFAGFCKDQKTADVKDENGNITTELVFDKDGNPEYTYSLRYEEWIMLIVHMVQKLYKKHEEQQKTIDKQQSEIDELKKSVSFLMEKLGGMENE